MIDGIKRSVLLSIACVLTCFSANAQTSKTVNSYSYIQANGGINFSKSYFDFYGRSFKAGANVGLSVGHKFNTPFFIESGINFTQKGSKVLSSAQVSGANSDNIRYEETLNYVSLPMGVGVELGNKVKVRFRQSASLDMLVNAYAEYDGAQFIFVDSYIDTGEDGIINVFPYDYNFKRFDLALASSVEIKIPFGNFYVGSNLQSSFGLLSILRNKSLPNKERMLVLQGNLSFGFQF